MDTPTDERLVQNYLAGDQAGFELLVRRYSQDLYQFVLRFTSSAVAAEDVVQETFLQMHHSAASFDPARRFKPWLFTIAANKARDYLRKRQRRRELPIDAQMDREDPSGRSFVDLLAADDESAVDEMLLQERRRAVRKSAENLPIKLREVLILAYYHRLAYKEIAEVVGVPLGTVKSRLHAAVSAFRHRYVAACQEIDKDGNIE